ncbi:hypothetical protein ZYGR_0N05630 [Zygosaccharomyces rouxii]|uniref:Histone-lysine N-methyltransferase, H3 lysine-79 specific n=2 Tax=Zygosaccharomyces rouxii TaxID=4956 RepID=C5DWA5_ZYGRC|nr:uncharacterized protein ZYRO0D13200g [Zygosaccharomyces rouxii]KAH9200982.1 histone methylation protein DOT1-domain-containing protein [Zygosaccharomyces rouxii]GAV49157.1 hypothetical protein ZYGR_0N05630 [Zygosaccharomyces rouxii]CAR28074.1 ZYRO0D13200p [Zygosaccharomyces rouxii]
MTDPIDDNSTENFSQVPTTSSSGSGSKRSRKNRTTELQGLLDEANKYNSHYEYDMPRGFLRDKSSKEDVIQEEETEDSKESLVPRKKSKGGRPRKNDINRQNGTKRSIPSPQTLIEEPAPKKKSGRVRSRKTDTGHRQDSTGSLTPMTPSSQGSEDTNTAVTAHLDDSRVRNQEKQNGVDNTFTNWNASTNDVRFDIIDLEYIKSHTYFEGEPTPSTVLTAKRREKSTEVITVKLQSVLFENYQEEYDICFTKDLNVYNPMSEIGKIVEYMAAIFLPLQPATKVQREVIPPMNRAFDEEDIHTFVQMVEKYNEIVLSVTRQETIDHLSTVKRIPSIFIHDFLHMVYTRSIFPQCRRLKQYEAFSNYVYGELLPGFLTEAFVKCQLNPNQLFMDLGSGVGNCVVQAALECGCGLSFGCEIMPNASDLTEAQYKELVQRCKLFGLKLPSIEYSLRQSFIDNKRVDELIPQCDVLLINNFLFDSDMNLQVEKLIQNAKVGCKIITLKNLRASGYTINFYNLESILNRLRVERFELKEDSVSWTHSGGEYYISTVMETMDESLFDPSLRQRSTRRPTRYTR